MVTTLFRITRVAELEALADFRDLIERACRENNIGEETAYALKAAVDEACTNVIEHGYAGMDPGSIILDLFVSGDRVVVTITDFGHSFEPDEPDRPDMQAVLDDHPTGGFGLYLIYQMVDDVDYQIREDGNSLILTKKRG